MKADPKREGETFNQFVGQLELLGYKVEWRNLVACDFGAPTKRKRMFLVARRDGQPIVWPAPTHGPGPGLKPYRTAAECIDWSIPGRSIFGRKKPLAEKTMWRIAQGLKRFIFENPKPYIVTIDNSSTARTDQSVDEPLSTVVTKARHVVVAPSLVKVNHGVDSKTGRREHDLREPLGTITSGGNGHAIVAAVLRDPKRADGGGGVVLGQHLEQPLPTVTTRDHHGLVSATLVNYRGSDDAHPGCADVEQPLPTISAQGRHVAEVRAFLTAYYGDDHAPGHGQEVTEPLRTITTKARLGLVTVFGVDYQIVDITLRMLNPDELLRCQFSPELAAGYDLSDAKTLEDKVLMIGNSVSPPPAIALLKANGAGQMLRRAA
jgi:DNA (cytosine-5)-methyltransferase 1